MSTLKKTPNAQTVLCAEFTFDIASGDAMLNTGGVLTEFKATAGVFDVVPLPIGARVVGGDVAGIVASNDSGTATVSVGDSANATRYVTTASFKTAIRTALVPTSHVYSNGGDIRITVANGTGDATQGKCRITLLYVVENRASENLKTR